LLLVFLYIYIYIERERERERETERTNILKVFYLKKEKCTNIPPIMIINRI